MSIVLEAIATTSFVAVTAIEKGFCRSFILEVGGRFSTSPDVCWI